jgi:hypothetical protein
VLCAVGFLLISRNLALQLRNPAFGRAKLMREFLGHIESMFAISFGYPSGLVQQFQNGLPGLIQLIRLMLIATPYDMAIAASVSPASRRLTASAR